jgi:hypothetical protein
MVSTTINNNTTQEYTVQGDRDSRVITVSASSTFSLLVEDIFPLNSGFTIMGFTGANLIGLTTYTGNIASGAAYFPQFTLQEYVDFSLKKEFTDAAINTTAQGEDEVVSFGLRETCSFNIVAITDKPMEPVAPIDNNPNGVQAASFFMDYCISKGPLEFMVDRDDRATFFKVALKKTAASRDGVGYQLYEDFEIGGIFESRTLEFKKVI